MQIKAWQRPEIGHVMKRIVFVRTDKTACCRAVTALLLPYLWTAASKRSEKS